MYDAMTISAGSKRPGAFQPRVQHAHKAPTPEPVDEPLPGEHPVPQEDPVPSPNPEIEDPTPASR